MIPPPFRYRFWGGISTDFFFQTTNYSYQKNNSGIEKIYIRFNQDILDIFGFTELNIKHSTIDFFITLQETPTKPKYSIMMGQKIAHFLILCISLLYLFLKPEHQFFFKFALPFVNEPTFSREYMMIFEQISEIIYL